MQGSISRLLLYIRTNTMPPKIWRLLSPPTPLQNTSESLTSPTLPLSPQPPPSSNLISSSSSPQTNTTKATTSTSTNLTLPPRLHLRTLIPSYLTPASTPTHKPTIPCIPPKSNPPPPSNPYPWLWKCHLCNSIYRLGVTRRCLEDGHFFCAVVSPPASPVSPTPPRPPVSSSTDALSEGRRKGEGETVGSEETEEVKARKKLTN